MLKNPRVVALGLAGFGIAYSTYGIVYFLPQIVKNFGLTNMQTGLVSAIPFLVAACGMIWYGRRSDRLMERSSHCAIAFIICAIGLVATALLPSPALRLVALCVAAFGAWSTLPVFWAMPTAFLSGAAAAAGVAYINSIANVAGFIGPFVMGWIKDATGSFDGGLLVIACVCLGAAIAILSTSHDTALEQSADAETPASLLVPAPALHRSPALLPIPANTKTRHVLDKPDSQTSRPSPRFHTPRKRGSSRS